MNLSDKQTEALNKIRIATAQSGRYHATYEKRRWPSIAPAVVTCKSLVKKGLVEQLGDDPQNQMFRSI